MIFVKPVYAQCPVCIITVGGGLLIAKKLGIDDLLVSIWLSGLNTAIAFWIASKIKNKTFNSGILWSLGFLIITFIYLFTTKQIGHPTNKFLGVDKVVFGMVAGFLAVFGGKAIDTIIRQRNKGKVVFYYQKVIIPVVLLLVTTGIFYGIMKIIK
jgi:Na+/H+ antiporter NhaC